MQRIQEENGIQDKQNVTLLCAIQESIKSNI